MSEGLKSLENIKKVKVDKDGPFSATFLGHDKRYCNDLSIIEKELKALEIIKNKEVDINNFLYFVNGLDDEDALGTYNGDAYRTDRQLTKQEYDLLKEVLL